MCFVCKTLLFKKQVEKDPRGAFYRVLQYGGNFQVISGNDRFTDLVYSSKEAKKTIKTPDGHFGTNFQISTALKCTLTRCDTVWFVNCSF